jgi:molybdopterin molybdotransferase
MPVPNPAELISVAEAIAILDAAAVRTRIERVPLAEALGRRLAEDLLTDRDYPPFDKSVMDGYAVRGGDLQALPAELRVVGEIAAGQAPGASLSPGQAIAIMTGAPLPPGADGVVPVEEVVVKGECIRVERRVPIDRYIARAGSDQRRGGVAIGRGAIVNAAQLAAAATVGAAHVNVFARPRVAVLATGDEIIPADQPPAPHQIRNANSPMLIGLLRQLGCQVVDLGQVIDRPELIRSALEAGMQHDAMLITGGMSMGRYDHVPRILSELGVVLKITKVRIKPGKPFVYGVQRDCHIFGLPGNPVSAMVCTVRLASRVLRRLGGGELEERWTSAALVTDLSANGPREFYQPVVVEATAEGMRARPLNWKGSGDVFTLAAANALLMRPENEPPRPAGSIVRVLPLL